MTWPIAVISVDVDPVDLHLVGYGHTGLAPDPLVHAVALPRLVEVFARAGVATTLFCVGREAELHAASIAAAAAAGHEIASHTWSHPLRFAGLDPDVQRAELERSRAALERASGSAVIGFRAPNFDMAAHVVPRLAAAGYRYDASAYPSPMLLPARLALALRSRDKAGVLRMSPWPFTWSRKPYVWRVERARVVEFPVAVTPALRMPVYHTLRYFSGDDAFARQLDGFARRGEVFSYVLHAVDVLGAAEDRVDARLGRHPGLDRPLSAKIALLERTLEAIVSRFDVRPYRDVLAPFAAVE